MIIIQDELEEKLKELAIEIDILEQAVGHHTQFEATEMAALKKMVYNVSKLYADLMKEMFLKTLDTTSEFVNAVKIDAL